MENGEPVIWVVQLASVNGLARQGWRADSLVPGDGNTDVAHGHVVEEDLSKRPTSVFGVWSTIYGAEGSHQALGAAVDWTEYGEQYRNTERPDSASCAPRDILKDALSATL